MSFEATARVAWLKLRDVERVDMKKMIDHIANNMSFGSVFLELTIFGMSANTHWQEHDREQPTGAEWNGPGLWPVTGTTEIPQNLWGSLRQD